MLHHCLILLAQLFLTIAATVTTPELRQGSLYQVPGAESYFVKPHYSLKYNSSAICSNLNVTGSLDSESTYQGGLIIEEQQDGSLDYRFWAMVSSSYDLSEVLYYYETPSNNTVVLGYRSIKADQFGLVDFKVSDFSSENCEDGGYLSLIFHYLDADTVSHYYIFGLGGLTVDTLSSITSQLSDFDSAHIATVVFEYSCSSIADVLSTGSCSESLSLTHTLTPGTSSASSSSATAVLASYSSSSTATTITLRPRDEKSGLSLFTTVGAAGSSMLQVPSYLLKTTHTSSVTTNAVSSSTNVPSPSLISYSSASASASASASSAAATSSTSSSVASSYYYYSTVTLSSFSDLSSTSELGSLSRSTTYLQIESASSPSISSSATATATSSVTSNNTTTTANVLPPLQGFLNSNRSLASFELDIPYAQVGTFSYLALNFTFNSAFVNSTDVVTVADSETVSNYPEYGRQWFALNITEQFQDLLTVTFDLSAFISSSFDGDFGVTALVTVGKAATAGQQDGSSQTVSGSVSGYDYELAASLDVLDTSPVLTTQEGSFSTVMVNTANAFNSTNTSIAANIVDSSAGRSSHLTWGSLCLCLFVWVVC